MQNDLLKILKSFNFQIEYVDLNELIDSFHLNRNTCFFIFDIKSDKCCYISPSIVNILGYNHKKYLNKGFLFLQTIIHPGDFSDFITGIVILTKTANTQTFVNNIALSINIKHKNNNWLKLLIHLTYFKKTKNNEMDVLLGFIEKENTIENETPIHAINISSREKEVLQYLAAGNSAKTIASELFISENTVITHRKNLIQKLNVKNSAELIKRSFELNILN